MVDAPAAPIPPVKPWAPGLPAAPSTPDAVDVWRADLATIEDGLEALLSPEERARAERIVDERVRVLWTRSRGVLRALLGRYLDRDPRELRFELGPYGKPALCGGTGLGGRKALGRETARPGGLGTLEREGARWGGRWATKPGLARPAGGLRFNLSHSGEIVLVAVTAGPEVGVDVEYARGRYTAEFLRAWTRHEAAVKCLGTGLTASPVAVADPATAGLWTAELDLGPRVAAAVAVEITPRRASARR
jgi:phosphopantetheinyl transferase